jgi:chromate reductase
MSFQKCIFLSNSILVFFILSDHYHCSKHFNNGGIMFNKWIALTCIAFMGPLAAETKVLAIAGSTRADSYNKKLIKEAAEMARQMGATVTVINLSDYPIPIYEGDLEAKQGMPPNAKKLRQLMMGSNAIIIASPEHNASVPAILKNVLDWTSRSEDGKRSRDAYAGKKIAIMSASPGRGGGARALVHLRAIIQDAGGEVIAKQVSIPNANTAFSAQNQLQNAALRQELNQEIYQLLH